MILETELLTSDVKLPDAWGDVSNALRKRDPGASDMFNAAAVSTEELRFSARWMDSSFSVALRHQAAASSLELTPVGRLPPP